MIAHAGRELHALRFRWRLLVRAVPVQRHAFPAKTRGYAAHEAHFVDCCGPHGLTLFFYTVFFARMNNAHQVSLFGAGDPTFDPKLKGVRRRQIGQRAWVDHLDGWLGGHEQLYDWLAKGCNWQQQRRVMYDRVVDVPRLVARCPSEGSAGRAGGAILRRMSLALTMHYGVAMPSISLNWYRNGQDSVAMHGDRMGRLTPNTVIAILSVGEPRRFNLRANDGSALHQFKLGWGDLLVMGGNCQEAWQHGVPKAASAGPRMSIVFRQALDAAPDRS